jgi:hypothetical protein
MKHRIILLLLVLFVYNKNTIAQYQQNDPIITTALSLINEDSVEYQLQWLQDMGTRFLMAPNHKNVALSIKSRFESYGITEVRLDSFECYTNINYSILHYDTTTWQYNVEAKIIGSTYPEEEILIMGHYDNVQLSSDPEIYSPGADDDGSGTVAVLETARVLMEMEYQPEMTIVFLATAAEELMYFGDAGSEYYAQVAADEGRNITAVINNDMIAYDEGTSMIGFSNVIGSEEITGIASLIVSEYTTLTADIPSPQSYSGADLQPFLDEGYTGLYLEEHIFNPYYHTDQDLVENCDISYLTEVIKISCGSVLYSDIHVGTDEFSANDIGLSLFPNPCTDNLSITFSGLSKKCTVSLLNNAGQLVTSNDINPTYQNILNINLEEFPSGIYVVRLVSEYGVISKKVIHN